MALTMNGERAGPAWLAALRRNALETFQRQGLPSSKNEDWRYTNVSFLRDTPYKIQKTDYDAKTLEALIGEPLGGPRLVFVDGLYSAYLSKKPRQGRKSFGAILQHTRRVAKTQPEWLKKQFNRFAGLHQESILNLNTAHFRDGSVLVVPARVKLAEPIELVFVTTSHLVPSASYPRNIIIVEEDASVSVVERFVGSTIAHALTMPVTDILLKKGASLSYCKIQNESLKTTHLSFTSVALERSSSFVSWALAFGGEVAREDLHARLQGEDSRCALYGLYLGQHRQVTDVHTTVDHLAPRCHSEQIYKGVLRDSSKGVFSGKVFVREGAVQTDAKQVNKNLLLSPEAQANTKPQLQIYADDVKCSHGAAIGQIDPEQLFYLRARGLGQAEAESLLLKGFMSEVSAKAEPPALRPKINELVDFYLMGRALP